MGKKSGPSAPPPPPDYTNQREAAVRAENSNRKNTANIYNSQISKFNKGLTDYGSSLSSQYGDSIFDLKLGDDLSGLTDIEKQIRDARGNLESFKSGDVSWMTGSKPSSNPRHGGIKGLQRNIPPGTPPPPATSGTSSAKTTAPSPDYQPKNNAPMIQPSKGLQYDAFGLPIAPTWDAAGSSYGQSVFYDMPTLSNLNYGLADRYISDLSDVQSAIDSLQAKEEAELARGKEFFTGYINDANQSDIDVEFAELNSDFEKYNRQLAQARNEINAFDSPLTFDQKANALSELDELEGIISGRIGEKTAEQNRIDQFFTGIPDDPSTPNVDESTGGIRGQIGDLSRVFGGLGIADVGDPTGYRDQIRALEDQLTGFDAELNFNIGGDLQDLYGLEDTLYNLERDRGIEQARLDGIGFDTQSMADQLSRSAGRSGYYDLYAIQDLQDQIAALDGDMGRVTSDLDFDYSGQQGTLNEARDVLSGLMSQRDGALASESAELEALMAGIGDINAYDEAGFNALRNKIDTELGDLGRFQGGTDANYNAIQDAFRGVDSRLENIATERGGREQEALALLQDMRNREFFDQSGLDAAGDEIEALRQQIETWGATQAQDELASLTDIYGDQASRLAQDAAAVQAREGSSAAEIQAQLDGYGNLQFANIGEAQEMLTDEQLAAYLAQLDEDDELLNTGNVDSAFVKNLLSGA